MEQGKRLVISVFPGHGLFLECTFFLLLPGVIGVGLL